LFPEGPVAMQDGSILLVEIERGTLTRVDATGERTIVAHCGGGPNGAALGPDGRMYICNNGGFIWTKNGPFNRPGETLPDNYVGGSIQSVNLEDGMVHSIYTECDGEPLKGPNDIVFDRQGGFYFTDLGKRRGRQIDRGSIFYAKIDGSMIIELIHPFDTPNGIGLSPDEKTLYVAETNAARLWAFDIESPGVLKKMAPVFFGRAGCYTNLMDMSGSTLLPLTPRGMSLLQLWVLDVLRQLHRREKFERESLSLNLTLW